VTSALRLVRNPAVYVAWVALALYMPTLLGTHARLTQLEYIVVLLILATGLNIVLGFAGQLFLGPSALFGVAGYAAAIAATRNSNLQSLWIMILIGIGASVVVAAIVALPSLRIGGFYLGMITLFLAIVIPQMASRWNVTGGNSGLTTVTDLNFVQNPTGKDLYYVGVGLLAASALYALAIKKSRLGHRFAAISQNDELAKSLAITTYTTKLTAFLLAAVPCGAAGGYYFYSQQFMNPDIPTADMSIAILAGITIGGGGTILGPVIGTAMVGAAGQFLGGFQKYEGIAYGVVLVAVAIGAPTGLMGLYLDLKTHLFKPKRRRPPKLGALRDKDAPIPAESVVVAQVPERNVDTEAAPEQVKVADTKPSLQVSNVRRYFGGVKAVDGVDLEVKRGSVHALVGPNGSGKTTLLNLISGFYRAQGGTVMLGDEALHKRPSHQIARLGVARTFQTPKLIDHETALMNVVLAANRFASGTLVGSVLRTPHAVKVDREIRAVAYEALERLGMADDWDRPAGLLPHGTQRLLEIARAMTLRPRFLLLDEPAAGLAAGEVGALSDAVRAIADSGVGVLIVEHNLPVVFGLADKVSVMHQGRVVSEGTPAEVSADPEVVRIYIGRSYGGDHRAERRPANPAASNAVEPAPVDRAPGGSEPVDPGVAGADPVPVDTAKKPQPRTPRPTTTSRTS
jgi:branched-chain amino acid transport system permease protein